MSLYKKENDLSYTLGITLTIELLKTKPKIVKNVYFHLDFNKGDAYNKISKLCFDNNIKIITQNKIFNQLSQKDNCYVIGEFYKYQQKIDISKNHLVLVNPSDAGNLGTILRSTLGFGIKDVVIINNAVDVYNPKTIRSSMGALFHLNVEYFDSFNDYLSVNLPHDYFPFMLKAKVQLQEINSLISTLPVSLIFGNEATGLSDEYLNIGHPVIIKHSSFIDSLNLPIAVSIALYEVTKNKWI